MHLSTPVWLRSWREGRQGQRVHIEVRDPDNKYRVSKTYRGDDHTLHIILKEVPLEHRDEPST